VDIFTAVDTPLTVRKMRWLVMSKLLIEDSRFISLDAALTATSERAPEPQKVDLPDARPTPLDSLLDKDMKQQVESVAESLLGRMRKEVRNKPYRYSKLIEVAWHCYFNPASPSQTSIARLMGISDSLVSHYRCIFDNLIRSLNLTVDEFVHLNTVLGHRLTALKSEIAMTVSKTKARADKAVKIEQLACQETARACAAAASGGS
jgi:sensor c-di-GMP phosphodiesterase-like protein